MLLIGIRPPDVNPGSRKSSSLLRLPRSWAGSDSCTCRPIPATLACAARPHRSMNLQGSIVSAIFYLIVFVLIAISSFPTLEQESRERVKGLVTGLFNRKSA